MIANRVSRRFELVEPTTKKSATIHLVQSSRFARRLAKLLLVGLVASILGMMFLPWQQSSRGTGQVVAYVPQERQQSIEAPTKGVVARIGKGLVEGSRVQQGDFILEIEPFAANMVEQLNAQLNDLQGKLQAAQREAEVYGDNVEAYKEARDSGVQAAQEMVFAAQAKLESKQRKIPGLEAKEERARLNYNRQKRLLEKELKAAKEVEKWDMDLRVAKSDLQAIHKDVVALRNELNSKKSALEEKRKLAQTKIEEARAKQQKALGSGLTIQKEIRDLEIKIKEMDRLIITAPRDGTIFRMPIYEQGQAIKEGEPILTLIPETSQKAVELLVVGNDMPLVQAGQEVRLQFEGWPAVQFAGWPSVAVGTFSGVVSTVDATDNGKGQFRVLVTPNSPEEWPSDRYLRQGVRANGWVMLRQVSLGYEIWRQLNGFPVIVSDEEPKRDKTKVPKLPK